jgi:hypothetical protein
MKNPSAAKVPLVRPSQLEPSAKYIDCGVFLERHVKTGATTAAVTAAIAANDNKVMVFFFIYN